MLISNAGIRRDALKPTNVLTASLEDLQESLWSHDEKGWSDSFKINTTAHFYLATALLPLLAASAAMKLPNGNTGQDEGRGVVIVMSSCASMHNCTNVDLSSYAATKAATDHLVKMLASKFSRCYVRVCGINPGCRPPLQSLGS